MFEPHLEINHRATRLPSPVLITAREINIAIPINQIVALAKPESAPTVSPFAESGVTPVSAEKMSAIIVTAPIGMTFRIIAKIVVANIANICHALAERPDGGGINQSIIPNNKVITPFRRGNANLTSMVLLELFI